MIFFFTDPHEGVSRVSNTTLNSARMLRDEIHRRSMELTAFARSHEDHVLCLGDLFDKHSNPEPIVDQGAELVRNCDAVLGGNHDIKNVVGSLSSLSLIDRMLGDESPVIINPDLSKPYFDKREIQGVMFYFIPHCLTQELFEESVKRAFCDVTPTQKNVLCLHCNVGDAYGQVEAEGSTLSLTDDLQAEVALHFDLTMVGHEHTPQKYYKGKIVVMGNLLPLSFGELANRYTYRLDPETMKLTMLCHFDVEKEVRAYNARDLDTLVEFEGSYVTIGGTVKPEGYPVLARQIQKIWSNSPNTLMVSNVVEIDRPDVLTRDRVDASKQTLIDIVRKEARAKGFTNELAELEAMK